MDLAKRASDFENTLKDSDNTTYSKAETNPSISFAVEFEINQPTSITPYRIMTGHTEVYPNREGVPSENLIERTLAALHSESSGTL